MPVKVTMDEEFPGAILEPCCICREMTPYWHYTDVAVCPRCAETQTFESLPSKKEWIKKERRLMKLH